jgi:hypothetical protein
MGSNEVDDEGSDDVDDNVDDDDEDGLPDEQSELSDDKLLRLVESVEPIQQMLTEVIEFNKHQQQYKVDTF